jgi:glycopeptide antibiotics resistance protein
MSYVVVPFSAAVPKPVFAPQTFAGNLLAMIVFGLIIAFFTHRFRNDGAR